MARRRDRGVWSDDQRDELGLGRFIRPGRWRVTCTRLAWCPRCSTGWWCGSFFADRDEAERCYWDVRDELLADENLGNRPRGWWMFEAPVLCRHDPPCAAPGGGGERDRWLDHHDLLSARERALLAPVEDTADG